jgi:histone acetyltransferase (RNA polymerase elongator complex component)
LIRELHVYWNLESLKQEHTREKSAQHKWYWSRLMELAEQISSARWYQALSVISWVWVKGFYEKIWYHREGTYMVKNI